MGNIRREDVKCAAARATGIRPDGKLLPLAEDRARHALRLDYRTRDEARASLFDYMEVFYNRQQRLSTIKHVAPLAFEASTTA